MMRKILRMGMVLVGMVIFAGCDVASLLGTFTTSGDSTAKMSITSAVLGTAKGTLLQTQTQSQLQDGSCSTDCDGTPDQIRLQSQLQDGSCLE